jgi:hypothetical protein
MVPTTFIGKLITFPAMMFGVLVSLDNFLIYAATVVWCYMMSDFFCFAAYCIAIDYHWQKFHDSLGSNEELPDDTQR